jgi:ribonuclease R
VTARRKLEDLCARHDLRLDYPQTVLREVDAILDAGGIDDPALIDLEASAFITIDNDDSRDLDQAMYIAREERGYRIDYALADAAHYVRPGSALFEEALLRGASYYLPGFSVPMLPRALSEDLVSLNEEKRRRAFVVRMHLDEGAEPVRTELFRARIRSRRKLSYAGVQRYYEGDPSLAKRDFTETLDLLAEVGRKRIRAKEERGVAEYDRLETEIGLTEDEARFTISARPRNDAEKYNEQISLLCNIEGARYLRDASPEHVQPIFRVHLEPPESRVRDFAERIAELVRVRGLDRRWRWDPNTETIGDYLARLPNDSRLTRAIHRQAVVINNPSRFSSEAGPHYGIGAEGYSRFSSPMREIVGIYTHQEAIEKLAGGGTTDPELRDRVIDAGNRAKATQNLIDKEARLLVIDQVLHADLHVRREERPIRRGIVLGVSHDKIYVELDDPPLEVKVYLEDLGRRLSATRERSALEGPSGIAFAVGDAIRLRVDRYDPARKRWSFDV